MEETQLQLITLLSEKKELLEKLIPFLEEERRCIIELKMEELSAVMERKSELLAQLQVTSKRCRVLMKKMSTELGAPEAKSLSPLLPKLGEAEREMFRELQGALLESGEKFESLSAANADLLGGALLTVNRSLEFFGRVLGRSNTYGDAGRMVGGGNRSRMVCREV